MRIKLPDFDNKKDLFAYLKENKSTLIAQKKTAPVYSEPFTFNLSQHNKGFNVTKVSAPAPLYEDVEQIRVKVVANTSNYIDSHMDMLLPDCWKKSILERRTIIPHLHDHIHEISAKVGEVVDIYSSDISLIELGRNDNRYTQCLVFITDVMKSYNEKIFNQYKSGKIMQHSIGMQYVRLELAINDPDYEKEIDFWNKYYPQVINKEVADEMGYFWVVPEIKLMENSCVLFGSNDLTPTLNNNVKSDNISIDSYEKEYIEPSNDTQNSGSQENTLLNAIKELQKKLQ